MYRFFIASGIILISSGPIQALDAPGEQIVLDEVVVTSRAAKGGYGASSASTGTKIDTPLMQTPMSIQVVPNQIPADQGVTSSGLTDLASVGIQSSGFGTQGDTFTFRGFTTSTSLWNGFRIEEATTNYVGGNGGVWMGNVDRLEILKGPSSVFYGRSEPGRAVNILTKKPQEEFRTEVETGIGSWSDRWVAADITGPIDKEKTLLYRLNIGEQDSRSWYRRGPAYHSRAIAPALEWRVTPDTTLTFEGQYRRLEGISGQPYMPIDPATGRPLPIDPSRTLLPGNGSVFDQSRTMIGLDHRFDADWSVSWKYMHHDVFSPLNRNVLVCGWCGGNGFNFPIVGGTLPADLMVGVARTRTRTDAAILDLKGKFSTFGIGHELVVGADYYNTRMNQLSGWDFAQKTDYFNRTAPFSASGR